MKMQIGNLQVCSHLCNKQFEISGSEYDLEFCSHKKQPEQIHPTPLFQSAFLQVSFVQLVLVG
uniref:Activating signal cointegrator 1 complex subunit 3 isoform X4 n=1 Tax=Rhizophora mucronata TaxID=61149 RepID=A0A2P2M961_RHIMU